MDMGSCSPFVVSSFDDRDVIGYLREVEWHLRDDLNTKNIVRNCVRCEHGT